MNDITVTVDDRAMARLLPVPMTDERVQDYVNRVRDTCSPLLLLMVGRMVRVYLSPDKLDSAGNVIPGVQPVNLTDCVSEHPYYAVLISWPVYTGQQHRMGLAVPADWGR